MVKGKPADEKPRATSHSGHYDHRSAWGLLANEAVNPTGVNLRTAMALMGDAKIQSQSEAHCDSHRLVVKSQDEDHKRQWAKQKANLHCGEKMLPETMPGGAWNSNWLPQVPYPSTHLTDPSTVVWWARRLEHHQAVLTSLQTSMTANRRCLTWHTASHYGVLEGQYSRSRSHEGWNCQRRHT